MKIRLVYHFTILSVIQQFCTTSGSTITGTFRSFEKDKFSDSKVILVKDNVGPKMCAITCMMVNICVAVNYLRYEHKCELLENVSLADALQYKEGSDYTATDRWTMKKGPCYPNPCTELTERVKCVVTKLQEHICIKLDEHVDACDFENDNPCFLLEDQTDDFDWKVLDGSTPSIDTGPLSAYEGNSYKYIETSLVDNNAVARLVSTFDLTSPYYCLTFAYHMYGDSGMGSLHIGTGTDNPETSIFSKYGNQGDNWITSAVNINGRSGKKLFIYAVRGTSYKGDIAIDDVRLSTKQCN